MKTRRILMGALALAVVAATIFACKKDTKSSTSNQTIKANAIELSSQHDMYVQKMLDCQAKKLPNKNQNEMDLEDVLNVIEEVIGVRPVIQMDTILLDNSLRISLDNDRVQLAECSKTEKTRFYLSSVDQILQNMEETDDLTGLYQLLDDIENDVLLDAQSLATDKEAVVNTIEVFKGSLALWNDVVPEDCSMKGPKTWARWKKLLFVAAADAVGAALGYFLGGIIVVHGIPMYMPPGAGTAAVSAALSYLALCVVGWAGT